MNSSLLARLQSRVVTEPGAVATGSKHFNTLLPALFAKLWNSRLNLASGRYRSRFYNERFFRLGPIANLYH